MATALFMEMITRMTDASCDQDHLEMIIHSRPQIPDRTAYILGRSKDDPVKEMAKIGQSLAGAGASCIAIPCVTAHYFHRELSEKIHVPIINAITATAEELRKHGDAKAGIMATDGTVGTGIFQAGLEAAGIEAVVPDKTHQQYVMDLIYGCIKAGKPVDMEKFRSTEAYLREHGAQTIILGCTELSMIKEENRIGAGFIDAMEVLAQRSVLFCGKALKQEYRELITGAVREKGAE